jgi:2'-5' RNA ligase
MKAPPPMSTRRCCASRHGRSPCSWRVSAFSAATSRAGLPPEPRKYVPHVTLARLRDPRRGELQEFLAAHATFRAEPLQVDRFNLIASYLTKAGSVYEDQADYPLTG